MTADLHYEAELRHQVVNDPVANIGCAPEEIDLDLSPNDLGVGSLEAVVLWGELSELHRRQARLARAFS